MSLYLGALPASLIAGFWLLRTFIDELRRRPVAAASPPANSPAALSAEHAQMAEAERTWVASLLGGSLVSAAGKDVVELIATTTQGCAPSPDKELRGPDGFPVFAARVIDLDTESVRDELREHGDSMTGTSGTSGTPEMLRALALLGKVLPEALETLNESRVRPREKTPIRVIWLTPNWPTAFSAGLTGWLQHTHLDGFGIGSSSIELQPISDDGQVFVVIDEIIDTLNRAASAEIILLISAVSHLGEATLDSWRSQNRLFSSQEQAGQIPGEAAVALILARPGTTQVTETPVAVHLTRCVSGKREKSANVRGRVCGTLIDDLIDSLVASTKLDPGKITAVISDTDHRDSRVNELLPAVTERFPNLEPLRDTLALGTAIGSVSPIGGLLALLCAAETARNSSGAGLCVTNQDAFARASMLALAVPETASPAAGTA
ncbi:hypothetical protein [Aromatoleum diolicum]|uniref:Uncharacterized protein n=1 Tax=Aromatoleum diolicum TaxID=75796 RepID=A0ABX1QD88_9RHOO|nr:hypothetical protein [Aromatoleum diolicum]NMG76329.1 hypothetical protein [Aromatoleum diolicum]